jgi:hypothetical protein
MIFYRYYWFIEATEGLREGVGDENGPKRCQTHRLGPTWVFFSFLRVSLILINTYCISRSYSTKYTTWRQMEGRDDEKGPKQRETMRRLGPASTTSHMPTLRHNQRQWRRRGRDGREKDMRVGAPDTRARARDRRVSSPFRYVFFFKVFFNYPNEYLQVDYSFTSTIPPWHVQQPEDSRHHHSAPSKPPWRDKSPAKPMYGAAGGVPGDAGGPGGFPFTGGFPASAAAGPRVSSPRTAHRGGRFLLRFLF